MKRVYQNNIFCATAHGIVWWNCPCGLCVCRPKAGRWDPGAKHLGPVSLPEGDTHTDQRVSFCTLKQSCIAQDYWLVYRNIPFGLCVCLPQAGRQDLGTSCLGPISLPLGDTHTDRRDSFIRRHHGLLHRISYTNIWGYRVMGQQCVVHHFSFLCLVGRYTHCRHLLNYIVDWVVG